MRSVIISGGGTGGHIFPAIAIADEIKRRYPDCNIQFVGALERMEMEKVPAAGYPITGLPISGFQRKKLWKNWNLPFKIIRSLWISNALVKKHKPDVVIGVGGYASAAITKRAQVHNIPTLLQEQNGYAGLTNKLLAKNASAICVAYHHMDRFFPSGKISITGNPIRSSILNMGQAKSDWYSQFGLSKDKPVLLIIGGSLGARSINLAVENGLDKLLESGIQIIWQTGKNYTPQIKEPKAGLSIHTFIKEMDIVYSLATMIVSRAGALSISELCFVGKPTFFVPSPNVAEDHQTKNALALVDAKAAILISDSEVQNVLAEKVLALNADEAQKQTLAQNIKAMAKPKAVEDIVDIVKRISKAKMRQFDSIESIYFVGIGGIGMSALARFCKHRNMNVYGYDKTPSPLTDQLIKEGIIIQFEEEVIALPSAFQSFSQSKSVVYTPAIPSSHKGLNYLIGLGYQPIKRSAFLGMIAEEHYTIAVAGTHGKTTTSTLLAHIVYEAGYKMLGILGGISTNFNSNYILQAEGREVDGRSVLVTEADEFDRSFLYLHPNVAVITSTDADHLDIYGEADELKKNFQAFANQVSDTLILQEEVDLNHPQKACYGKGAINQFKNIQQSKGLQFFDGTVQGKSFTKQKAGLAGMHNIENAMGALVAASTAGIDLTVALASVASFKGVKRRFEKVFETASKLVLDDYAHHPAELNALISSIRALYPNRKLNMVFQPHLFSRTQDFMDEFAEALSKVDALVINPIYPARELPIKGVTSKVLLEKVKLNTKELLSKEEAIEKFSKSQPDLLVVAGAGDIDRIVKPIVQAYKNEKPTQ